MTWKPRVEAYCSWCRRMVQGKRIRGGEITPAVHYRYFYNTYPDPLNRYVKMTVQCPGYDELRPDVTGLTHGMEDPAAAFSDPYRPFTNTPTGQVKVSGSTTSSPSARLFWGRTS